MYFCYIDESGTPDIPGTSSHYVLCGLAIPIDSWKKCDNQIRRIKHKYGLDNAEIHTGWILRAYLEQNKIPDFENKSYQERRALVYTERSKEIYRLQKAGNNKLYKQTKKNYRMTESYVHLTYAERMRFIEEIADKIGSWQFARIFAEGIDKTHFNPTKKITVDEMALEQVVSRFEQYMRNTDSTPISLFGAIIHDNNETVAKRHTQLMQKFHKDGTLWTKINHIIETPLFVNSELTSMVQLADLCSFVLRRFFESGEVNLFNRIKRRIDKYHGKMVGIRHYSNDACTCEICVERQRKKPTS
ncbi:MAG: DUF3800 domain-containing protein [Muribaculaceae bacterium]|nr:DUF3800 domain-containing protein [Muribaculaceae bacterium]